MAVTDLQELASMGNDAPDPAMGGSAVGSGPPLVELVRELRARIDELELRIYHLESKQKGTEHE